MIPGDPYCTFFVGRISSHLTSEETLREAMHKYGKVKSFRLVKHIGKGFAIALLEGASRGYAFVEYEPEKELCRAYEIYNRNDEVLQLLRDWKTCNKLHIALRKALTDDEFEELKESSLGVFIKFKEQDLVGLQGWFTTCLAKPTLRRSMRCGLVGPEPLRFSPLEFENLTSLNRESTSRTLRHQNVTLPRDGFFSGMPSSSEAGPTIDR
ncbi:hypothetical protein Bca52824_041934 [Brassica carinata]|uniref:RRM domain-containing protein n=1 Tax=Brassica carinata TaxID=52824 RepID=A0A8X7RVT8_BRACI|nr:hypothetical protein Bca52824_041934 [Brassica carinata]